VRVQVAGILREAMGSIRQIFETTRQEGKRKDLHRGEKDHAPVSADSALKKCRAAGSGGTVMRRSAAGSGGTVRRR